jgi:terminase small subunit-like protein
MIDFFITFVFHSTSRKQLRFFYNQFSYLESFYPMRGTEPKLTEKQEAYCQAYIVLGNQSDAYREAYDASGMAKNSIWVAASRLHNEANVALRIDALRNELYQRNKITIDELVSDLAGMVRFDPTRTIL